MLKDKKILITGAAGVIGKELVEILQQKGAYIRAVDLVEKPKEFGDSIEYYQNDLSHPIAQFLFRFEPDYVFHLAADFERSQEDALFWDSNFTNNILASHYLLKEVVKYKTLKKFIFASSYLIYNKELYHNNSTTANMLSEESSIDPRNLCGVAKLQTERDIEFLCEQAGYRFDYVSARIFRVYGKGSRDIISRWVRLALQGEKLSIFDQQNSFDYIYAGDVASGLVKMIESKDAQGVVNLGTGMSTTIRDVAAIITKLLSSARIQNTEESIYTESSCADVTKLKKVTGWLPSTSLEDGIRKIIAYEQKK